MYVEDLLGFVHTSCLHTKCKESRHTFRPTAFDAFLNFVITCDHGSNKIIAYAGYTEVVRDGTT